MKQKRYWLRGLGVGLIVYVVIAIASVYLIFGGIMTCNEFVTVGPGVQESFLCKPLILLIAMPVMILSELYEDILHATVTHAGLYSGLLASFIVYFGICAFLGWIYGKIKNRNKTTN